MRLLSKRAQTAGIIGSIAAVAGAIFLLIIFTIMTDKARTSVNSESTSVNATFTNTLDGAEDASDMAGLLMLMVFLGAVFSVGLGAFLIRR